MFDRWKKILAKPGPACGAAETATDESAIPRPRRLTGPGTRATYPPAFQATVSLLSDTGCVRSVNEDCGRWIEARDVESQGKKGLLLMVADGMGGHAAGEIASRMAVETISRVYYESPRDPKAALAEAFHAANLSIHQAARQKPQFQGMGTTCTALVLRGGAAYAAQVGDSRLYLVRGGEIFLMSEDHSAVMEMVRRGKMTIEEARSHTDKNVILRALGTHPEVSVATWETPFPVQDQDHFILCSDGLYDLVGDEEIMRTILGHEPQAACEALIALARQRGGHDNITAAIARLSLPENEAGSAEIRRTREFSPIAAPGE
jgi:protein phosphatase